MNELKPCPFCGGEDVKANTWTIGITMELYDVSCTSCRCTSAWHSKKSKAIAAWNRRANLGSCENELIVRCENCKHYNRIGCSKGFGWCERMDKGTNDDFYCSLAERSEG